VTDSDRNALIRALYTSGPTYENYVNAALSLEDVERAFFETYCARREIRICDIGCGNGREAIALYEAGYRHVWPIDLVATMLAAARRNAAGRGADLPFVQALAEALPFADGSFDVVILTCNMYGHITPRASRVKTMREVARVLKPGGLVFVTCTSRYHARRARAGMWVLDVLRHLYNPQRAEPGDRPMSRWHNPSEGVGARVLIHWFYPDEIPNEARQAGLEVVCSSTVAGFTRNPRANARSWHGQGWLAYVLRRPAGSLSLSLLAR
jgi:SAM-dependent methyltransferase